MTPTPSSTPTPRLRRLLRHVPLALILVAAVVGTVTLRDQITFEALRENRAALLAFRDAHYLVMVLGFIAAYVTIVAFSLPGAAVASVSGGFLFGLALGTRSTSPRPRSAPARSFSPRAGGWARRSRRGSRPPRAG